MNFLSHFLKGYSRLHHTGTNIHLSDQRKRPYGVVILCLRVTQHYLANYFQSRFLNKLVGCVFQLKSSFFLFFHFIVSLNMIDNWVMCIIQWSNYVVRIIYDQKALIWFQSQLPSSNRLEMASKWRWHMKMLSFQLLSKECHHHKFLALYSFSSSWGPVGYFKSPLRTSLGP